MLDLIYQIGESHISLNGEAACDKANCRTKCIEHSVMHTDEYRGEILHADSCLFLGFPSIKSFEKNQALCLTCNPGTKEGPNFPSFVHCSQPSFIFYLSYNYPSFFYYLQASPLGLYLSPADTGPPYLVPLFAFVRATSRPDSITSCTLALTTIYIGIGITWEH
ncbi:hypothetical protein Nepgr_030175 [Nepenthes gracilis]|uniref:Uncharacterized protein n=1 Tax=Nepenthes gracilis TaxID=150966 RepID=A0AAD3Y3P0_NEPGR|nr:hypothetical protein Nepgr_030175 [Nepenthes gracilis]